MGVGAHGNRTLGASAIGGMLIGMIFQIFIVPVLFNFGFNRRVLFRSSN